MQTPINQDFDEYRDDFFKGFTKKETLWAGAGLLIGMILMFVLMFVLQLNSLIALFVTTPVTAGLCLNGFYNKYGMSLGEIIKKKKSIMFGKPLVLKQESYREYRIHKLASIRSEDIASEKAKGSKNGKGKTKGI